MTNITPRDFQLLVLHRALRLEIRGMKRSKGQSAATIIKKQFDLKGTNVKVLEQYEVILQEKGLMSAPEDPRLSQLRDEVSRRSL